MKRKLIVAIVVILVAGCAPLGSIPFESMKMGRAKRIIPLHRWVSQGKEGLQSDMIPREDIVTALYCEVQYLTGARLLTIRGHYRYGHDRFVYYAAINPENRIILLAVADMNRVKRTLETMVRDMGREEGAIWNPDRLADKVAANNLMKRAAGIVPLLPTPEMLIHNAASAGKKLTVEEAEEQIDAMPVASFGISCCYAITVRCMTSTDAEQLKKVAEELEGWNCASMVNGGLSDAIRGNKINETWRRCLERKNTVETIASEVVHGGYASMGGKNYILFSRFVRSLVNEGFFSSIFESKDIGDVLVVLENKLQNPEAWRSAQGIMEQLSMETKTGN